MPVPLFTGNVIAVVWDFDQTLIPGYQQGPLFEEYGIDANKFWAENNALPAYYAKHEGIAVSADTLYLNHLLTYVEAGVLKGLTNAKLKELGSRLTFYEGIPAFLPLSKQRIEEQPRFRDHGITVEHYILSTGLRQMILGSAVAPFVTGVWACEFIESPAAPGYLEKGVPAGEDKEQPREIRQIATFLDNTTKTRAIWEINKGTNVDAKIGVNDYIGEEDRRVPIPHMVFIADGPTDVPVFSILNKFGGRTLGVYNPSSDEHFKRVKTLRDNSRVQHFAEADYREGKPAARWILATLEEIADAIVTDRERALHDRVHPSVGHVTKANGDGEGLRRAKP